MKKEIALDDLRGGPIRLVFPRNYIISPIEGQGISLAAVTHPPLQELMSFASLTVVEQVTRTRVTLEFRVAEHFLQTFHKRLSKVESVVLAKRKGETGR